MEIYQLKCLSVMMLIFCLPAKSQILYPDVQSLGLGGAVVANSGTEGVFYNPAGVAFNSSLAVTGSLIFPYIGTGLKSLSAGLAVPWKSYVVGAALEVLGDDSYQQSRVSSLISRNFGSFSLGFRPEWKRERVGDTPGLSEMFVTMGTRWQVTEWIYAGFLIKNSVLTSGNNPVIQAGLSWLFSDYLTAQIQWTKRLQHPATLAAGMHYAPGKRLSFSTALRLKPARLFFGISFLLQDNRLDYAIGLDPYLGVINGIGTHWTKGK